MAKIVFDDGKEVQLSEETVRNLKRELGIEAKSIVEFNTYCIKNDRLTIYLTASMLSAIRGGNTTFSINESGKVCDTGDGRTIYHDPVHIFGKTKQ
jgi:hypothetical protein